MPLRRFFSADGNYVVTLMTKATLHPDGKVVWEPPAIYKSSCTINVEFFPFDEQECDMMFGVWSYDGTQVALKHVDYPDEVGEISIEKGIDMSKYYYSVEWDVLDVPAQINIKKYPCCEEPFPDVTFKLTIRRKTLFYTVNLIIPCVAISFLTVLVFYLPSDSGEKITLCISILLSLTVFFLLLADLIPPTSLVVPLIGKYLLFTMILVTLSILVTVVVLNVHNRKPDNHKMSPWVRKVFLCILPKVLLMRKPTSDKYKKLHEKFPSCNGINIRDPYRRVGRRLSQHDLSFEAFENNGYKPIGHYPESVLIPEEEMELLTRVMGPDVLKAMDSVKFIAQHLRRDDEEEHEMKDWQYVAMVIDRLFLWIFTTACFVGTFGIILQAPALYDVRKAIGGIGEDVLEH